MLSVEAIEAGYGKKAVLHGVSLAVGAGEVVALLGRNGMGKTTTLRAIMGLTPPARGRIRLDGTDITAAAPERISRLGIGYVPEGRGIFPTLSVAENLVMPARRGPWTLARVLELFPVLGARRHARSKELSGGQQQMVAIGRALMSNPRLLLCDELSLGLAPIVVREIYARLPDLVAEGLSIAVVEQDIAQALAAASRAYCLQEGKVALSGRAAELTREAVSAAYFG